MPEPAIGRIVHFVVNEGPSKGQSRPAQIVAVFPQSEGPALINCVVTLDGLNDIRASEDPHHHAYVVHAKTDDENDHGENGQTWGGPGTLHQWQTSVAHAEAVGSPPTYPPYTWHWPPGMS